MQGGRQAPPWLFLAWRESTSTIPLLPCEHLPARDRASVVIPALGFSCMYKRLVKNSPPLHNICRFYHENARTTLCCCERVCGPTFGMRTRHAIAANVIRGPPTVGRQTYFVGNRLEGHPLVPQRLDGCRPLLVTLCWAFGPFFCPMRPTRELIPETSLATGWTRTQYVTVES